jgi:hypothetical protein
MGWILLLEAYNLWQHVSVARGNGVQIEADQIFRYMPALGISVAIDALLVSIAFWRVGCPVIQSYLKRG